MTSPKLPSHAGFYDLPLAIQMESHRTHGGSGLPNLATFTLPAVTTIGKPRSRSTLRIAGDLGLPARRPRETRPSLILGEIVPGKYGIALKPFSRERLLRSVSCSSLLSSP